MQAVFRISTLRNWRIRFHEFRFDRPLPQVLRTVLSPGQIGFLGKWHPNTFPHYNSTAHVMLCATRMSSTMRIKVFVQNEAGSNLKNHHDEKTLTFRFAEHVSRPYPFPYGFVVGTTAQDGCNLDCYLITRRDIRTGTLIECEPVALMEQFEDGIEDHNVLAVPVGENADVTEATQKTLVEFVENVFRHRKGKELRAGRFLSATEAKAHIQSRTDSHSTD